MKKIANYTSPRSGEFGGGASSDDRHLPVWAWVKPGDNLRPEKRHARILAELSQQNVRQASGGIPHGSHG
jgi:hypothetical protein